MASAAQSNLAQDVPRALVSGTPMQKISSKKIKQVVMKVTDGSITWAGSGDSKSE